MKATLPKKPVRKVRTKKPPVEKRAHAGSARHFADFLAACMAIPFDQLDDLA